MRASAFPDDVDWTPPLDVFRIIAKQTQQVEWPADPFAGSPSRSPSRNDQPSPSRRSLPSPRHSMNSCRDVEETTEGSPRQRASASVALSARSWTGGDRTPTRPCYTSRSHRSEGRADSASSASSAESFNLDDIPCMDNEIGMDDNKVNYSTNPSAGVLTPRSLATDCSNSPAVDCSHSPRLESHFTSGSIHEVPWDGIVRPSAELYTPATAEVCACRTPFDDDDSFCKRCGARRPVRYPETPSYTHAVVHFRPDEKVVDRQKMWASLYASRLYSLQLQTLEDQERVEREELFTPRTNPHSRKIAKSKNRAPLVERVDEILKAREEKLEQQREEAEKAELKEVQAGPEIHPKSKHYHRGLKSLVRWEKNKKMAQNIRMDRRDEAEARECSFKPWISSRSQKISSGYVRQQVHTRLVQDSRRRQIETDNSMQFSPLARLAEDERSASPRKPAELSLDVLKGRFDWNNTNGLFRDRDGGTRGFQKAATRASSPLIAFQDALPGSAEAAKLKQMKEKALAAMNDRQYGNNRKTMTARKTTVNDRASTVQGSRMESPWARRRRKEQNVNAAAIGTTHMVKCSPEFYSSLELAHQSYD